MATGDPGLRVWPFPILASAHCNPEREVENWRSGVDRDAEKAGLGNSESMGGMESGASTKVDRRVMTDEGAALISRSKATTQVCCCCFWVNSASISGRKATIERILECIQGLQPRFRDCVLCSSMDAFECNFSHLLTCGASLLLHTDTRDSTRPTVQHVHTRWTIHAGWDGCAKSRTRHGAMDSWHA